MSSINGLQSAFSSSVNFTTRYKNDGYDNMDVLDEFNGNGPDNISHHIICALGHGGPTNFAAANGSLNRTHMDNLTNVDRGQIFCMTHCSTMPWNRNTVVEHYINSENGGIAVTGNTHVGWDDMVTSHNYKFINNIYNNNNKIGLAFKLLKAYYTNYSYRDGRKRMQFFAHSLASDPELPVWTDVPDPATPLIVTTPTSIYTGEQTIPLSVDNLTLNTEATICLYKENEVYEIENITGTGSTINVNITCVPDTPGDINVTVTAKNYLPVDFCCPLHQIQMLIFLYQITPLVVTSTLMQVKQ